MFKKLFFTAFFLSFLLLSPQVQAEDNSSTDSSSLRDSSTGQIWLKDQLADEIIDVKAQYQAQLVDYLAKEKLYQNAFDQNQQLQTLASKEDSMQKAKSLGLIRDQVLLSYLTLLKLKLIETTGIELSLKTYFLEQLESRIIYLKNHQAGLESLTERSAISASLSDFALHQENLEDLAKEVQVILSVGKLQIIYDKAVVLKVDVDQHLESQEKSENAIVARASLETKNSLESTRIKLNNFWVEALNRYEGGFFLSRLYDQLPRELNPTYVNLSQSLSYLDELLNS